MNREENIKSLTHANLHQKELIKLTDDDDLKLVNIGVELYLKLLSLPKRTLETLEVGDWVEVTFVEDEEWGDRATTSGTVIEVVHLQSGYMWFRVNEYEIGYDEVIDIKIIPHEAIELLKEVIGND